MKSVCSKGLTLLLVAVLVLSLGGCKKQAEYDQLLLEKAPEEIPTNEIVSPLEIILYSGWSDGNYYIVSQNIDNSRYQVNLYDKSLLAKDCYTKENLEELMEYLPDGAIFADRERNVLVTHDWKRPIEKTMGERFSVTPDLSTLLYSSSDKSKLYVDKAGEAVSYEFKGLVDLKCINNHIVWLSVLSDDHQSASILFDFVENETLMQKPGSYDIEFCEEFILLRPSFVDGIIEEPLCLFDLSDEKEYQTTFSANSQKPNIRMSENGQYTLAGENGVLTVYNTEDFSVFSTLNIDEEYDAYENSRLQTVSNDASTVLIFDSKSKNMVHVQFS